jgi:hypothetical protein
MIRVSQMKNVKPFTCDSFVIDEEYVCVKTTYNRLSRELVEEFLPATITHKHEPSMMVVANVQEFVSQGYVKDVVFNKTRDSRGLFTARPEISGPQTAVSVSHILVRNENEWHTIKYMRDLAEVLISKMGTAYDSFSIAGMDFEQLENMRKMVWQIEYNRNQAAFYKGCSASLDFYGGKAGYGKKDEWNCSFFDKYGNLHRFLANDFESMKLNFEKAVDRIETLERYSAFEHGDAARILDKETGEHIGSFEDIYKAKAFIKNNLAKAAKCGMVDTGETNEN